MAQHRLEPHPIATLTASPPSSDQLESAFTREGSWSGSDVMAPTVLTDGSIWFVAGDTWLGPPNEDGTPCNLRMTRNCVVSLRRGQLTAWFGPRRSTPLLAGTPDTWLWPCSAVADAYGHLKILSTRMRRTQGLWPFQIDGYDISVLRFSDMAVTSSRPTLSTQGGAITWNGSATKHGSYVYIYGFRWAQPYGHQLVARTSVSTINFKPWDYWTGETWSPDISYACPLDVTDRPLCALWVTFYRGEFIASAHLVDASDKSDILAWRAVLPTGPFLPLGPVGSVSVPSDWMSYAGRIFPTTRDGEFVAMHSVNRTPGIDTPINVHQYGPHFGAVTLP